MDALIDSGRIPAPKTLSDAHRRSASDIRESRRTVNLVISRSVSPDAGPVLFSTIIPLLEQHKLASDVIVQLRIAMILYMQPQTSLNIFTKALQLISGA